MEILSASEEGVRYLGFVGAFDTPEVDTFNAHVDAAIDEQHFKIVINAGQMTFINSTALGSLIRAQKRLKQYGGDLAIAELSGFAVQVFKTLGIDRKVRCFPSEQEAITYLRSIGTEGVGVEGEVQVAFHFTAPAQTSAAGADPRIGVLKMIGEQGLSLQWENLDHLDVDAMFAAGAPIVLRFHLPLYHESHLFQADATVTGHQVTAGDRVVVQTRFVHLSDAEKAAVQQYVRDLRYLKGELS
jgi:anti-anti-sigma factor